MDSTAQASDAQEDRIARFSCRGELPVVEHIIGVLVELSRVQKAIELRIMGGKMQRRGHGADRSNHVALLNSNAPFREPTFRNTPARAFDNFGMTIFDFQRQKGPYRAHSTIILDKKL